MKTLAPRSGSPDGGPDTGACRCAAAGDAAAERRAPSPFVVARWPCSAEGDDGTKGRGEGPAVCDVERVGPLRRFLQRTGLAVSLALVFAATLRPADGPNHLALAPWAARQLNPGNVLGNIALFALPAAFLPSLGWSLRRTVVAGFALSLGIELVQLAIPGRTTATADVVCNTLGAAVGWLVAARSPLRRRRLQDGPASAPPR